MIYLSTAISEQTITFIPRKFVISADLAVTDEMTGVVQDKAVGISKLNNLGSISVPLVLLEGRFYELRITSVGSNWDKVEQTWNLIGINWEEAATPIGATWATAQEEWSTATGKWDDNRETVAQTIYNDRIFCTDQTISQRSQEYYDPILGDYESSTARDNTYEIYTP